MSIGVTVFLINLSSKEEQVKFVGYEDDYIGNVDEKRIHVYEVKESSFIQGKSYYLFMSSFRSPIYPHVGYARKVGDKFIVLGKYDEDYQSYGVDYSSELFIYPLMSSEVRYIIKSINK